VGEPDLVPYLTAIMAAKPEAVIFATGGASMTNVLKAIRATGISEKVAIWIHTATDHAVLKPLGAEAPEGVMGTMDYHFYYPDTPANRTFVKAFQDAYGNPPGFPAFHAYVTAHLIAKAFKKVGAINREKFIDALEGMKVDSPVGEVEMRGCDHQAVLPMFMGVTRKVPEYAFLISGDITTISAEDVMPSVEEIKKAREK
jgi:branched-chain amino acid transport system substrate-binding protein